MDVTITRSSLRGTARAPPSKSYTHRAILAAGYSSGALVYDPLDSADPRATARAVEAFGGDVSETDDGLEVEGFAGRPDVPADVIDCGNSGTTMRLVTGTAALADGITVLTGDGSLRSRPQGPLLDAIGQLGGRAESTRGNGQAPLVIEGPVSGGEVSIPGDVSSQYITALLMAGAVTEEGIEIDLETELKSAPYVDITLEVLNEFGVEAEPIDAEGGAVRSAGASGFRVPGNQSYEPYDGEYHVPGDFSSISYLVAAGVLAAEEGLTVRGAQPSAQGDTAIVDVVERMGGTVEWDCENGLIEASKSDLSGITVDVGDTPDLLPTIATLGAVADGETRITNCEHVRYKETDRVSAMAAELAKLGASVEESEDELVVHGGDSELSGSTVEGYDDHRVIMALAVAGLVAAGETVVRGAEHVDVSFPEFFDVLYDLGATIQRQ
ncbi:3-phosphoshikimate 1-carboxyvinyltransferase [Halalkalicoccus sp. NIPERK01]|uniref:3-phosphoshikimate 1-carboxyvinyltransferase n=1 Tax=Halalkalicoccus sp. NIPERK01 TaxID=3053469 RepID=UPI00256ED314|nr:3-phosphoshikimate 1-carboxyvinyltransferase [Halalkalicoccus sp. NIPERK01]MDL5361068.1 3-phosphoshikimate 1-carboxyvinyltransferase [Halalkalicoccus sp. NIPERK01]